MNLDFPQFRGYVGQKLLRFVLEKSNSFDQLLVDYRRKFDLKVVWQTIDEIVLGFVDLAAAIFTGLPDLFHEFSRDIDLFTNGPNDILAFVYDLLDFLIRVHDT